MIGWIVSYFKSSQNTPDLIMPEDGQALKNDDWQYGIHG